MNRKRYEKKVQALMMKFAQDQGKHLRRYRIGKVDFTNPILVEKGLTSYILIWEDMQRIFNLNAE